jgi:AbrB family looped-hinge helix DNA binding protein
MNFIRIIDRDSFIMILYNQYNQNNQIIEICQTGGNAMGNKNKDSCYDRMGKGKSCCKVEAVVSIDERGQMILPKEIRDKANIKSGDKLTVVSWENDGRICCISLIRAEDFGGMLKDMLGPMMKDMVTK